MLEWTCQWSSLSFISTCPSPAIKSTIAIWYSIVTVVVFSTLLHKHCCRYNMKSDYESNNNRTDREQAQNKWWNVGEHTYCRYRSFAITRSDFFLLRIVNGRKWKAKIEDEEKNWLDALTPSLRSMNCTYGTLAHTRVRTPGLTDWRRNHFVRVAINHSVKCNSNQCRWRHPSMRAGRWSALKKILKSVKRRTSSLGRVETCKFFIFPSDMCGGPSNGRVEKRYSFAVQSTTRCTRVQSRRLLHDAVFGSRTSTASQWAPANPLS